MKAPAPIQFCVGSGGRKACSVVVPLRLAAGLAGQMDHRRPAARHQQAVGVDACATSPVSAPRRSVEALHLDAGHAPCRLRWRRRHGRSGARRRPRRRGCAPPAKCRRARRRSRRRRRRPSSERSGRAIGAVIVGEERRSCRPAARRTRWRSARPQPASMTPGRSLPGNTSGRSKAPVASTTAPARIDQWRWRGSPLPATALWSVTRSSAASVLPS